MFNEIGQIVVPGALTDTKKIRKTGRNIFANVRPEKTKQLKKNIDNPENWKIEYSEKIRK